MSSKQPHSEPVLFLDRNLGKHVIAEALRSAGICVEVHDDHLPIDAPDEDWIALAGRKGWIVLTKDKNIRYRHAQLASGSPAPVGIDPTSKITRRRFPRTCGDRPNRIAVKQNATMTHPCGNNSETILAISIY